MGQGTFLSHTGSLRLSALSLREGWTILESQSELGYYLVAAKTFYTSDSLFLGVLGYWADLGPGGLAGVIGWP